MTAAIIVCSTYSKAHSVPGCIGGTDELLSVCRWMCAELSQPLVLQARTRIGRSAQIVVTKVSFRKRVAHAMLSPSDAPAQRIRDTLSASISHTSCTITACLANTKHPYKGPVRCSVASCRRIFTRPIHKYILTAPAMLGPSSLVTPQ